MFIKDSLRHSRYAIIFLLLTMFSCGGEDTEPATNGDPALSITSPVAGKTVWNTVRIKMETNDASAIEGIGVFIDDKPLGVIGEAPFEIEWDSNTATDGNHVIKAVAIFKSGKESTATVEVTVKNILLSIDIAPNMLLNDGGMGINQRAVIFLSDAAGKVIASQQVVNGQKLQFKSTSFSGDQFYVTEAFINEAGPDNKEVQMFTYPLVERGTWTATPFNEWVTAKSLNLQFTNAAKGTDYILSSDVDYTVLGEGETQATLPVLDKPLSTVFVVRNEPLAYGIFEEMNDGSSINLSQVNTFFSYANAAVPTDAYSGVFGLTGFRAENNYSEAYHIDFVAKIAANGQVDFGYPGDAFATYYSETEYSTDRAYVYTARRSVTPDFTVPTLNFQYTLDYRTLGYSATGDADIVACHLLEDSNPGSIEFWTIMLPMGAGKSFVIPELPAELKSDVSIDPINGIYYYSAYDFENVTSYNDVKTVMRTSPTGANIFFAQGKNYRQADVIEGSSGGRMGRKGGLKFRGAGFRPRKNARKLKPLSGR